MTRYQLSMVVFGFMLVTDVEVNTHYVWAKGYCKISSSIKEKYSCFIKQLQIHWLRVKNKYTPRSGTIHSANNGVPVGLQS